jgi:hypothetical protein
MRLSSSTIRTLMKAGSFVVLLLLCSSVATAAPAHRRARARVCDAHRAKLAKLRSERRPVGPVAPPSTRALAGLADPTLLLTRGGGTNFDTDVDAIQNDTPAARIDAGLRLAPAFEPVGVVARISDRLPKLHRFSPRSPRGPPVTA